MPDLVSIIGENFLSQLIEATNNLTTVTISFPPITNSDDKATPNPQANEGRASPLATDSGDVLGQSMDVHAFAVGTVVTDRPPHRTARAEFPHAAPTLGV